MQKKLLLIMIAIINCGIIKSSEDFNKEEDVTNENKKLTVKINFYNTKHNIITYEDDYNYSDSSYLLKSSTSKAYPTQYTSIQNVFTDKRSCTMSSHMFEKYYSGLKTFLDNNSNEVNIPFFLENHPVALNLYRPYKNSTILQNASLNNLLDMTFLDCVCLNQDQDKEQDKDQIKNLATSYVKALFAKEQTTNITNIENYFKSLKDNNNQDDVTTFNTHTAQLIDEIKTLLVAKIDGQNNADAINNYNKNLDKKSEKEVGVQNIKNNINKATTLEELCYAAVDNPAFPIIYSLETTEKTENTLKEREEKQKKEVEIKKVIKKSGYLTSTNIITAGIISLIGFAVFNKYGIRVVDFQLPVKLTSNTIN